MTTRVFTCDVCDPACVVESGVAACLHDAPCLGCHPPIQTPPPLPTILLTHCPPHRGPSKPSPMHSCLVPWLPPTAVSHCTSGHFTAPTAKNLVTAAGNLITLFDVTDRGSNLIRRHEMTLTARVMGLQSMRVPGRVVDSLVLLLGEDHVSILEWFAPPPASAGVPPTFGGVFQCETAASWHTVALVQLGQVGRSSRTAASPLVAHRVASGAGLPPILRVDGTKARVAVLSERSRLTLITFGGKGGGGHAAAASTTTATAAANAGPTIAKAADAADEEEAWADDEDDHRQGDKISSSTAAPATASRLNNNGANDAATIPTGPPAAIERITVAAAELTLPQSFQSSNVAAVRGVRDFVFVESQQGVTVAILRETEATWSGRIRLHVLGSGSRTRALTCAVTFFSLEQLETDSNLHGAVHPVPGSYPTGLLRGLPIADIPGVPFNALSLVAVPPPPVDVATAAAPRQGASGSSTLTGNKSFNLGLGGAVVVCANSLLHVTPRGEPFGACLNAHGLEESTSERTRFTWRTASWPLALRDGEALPIVSANDAVLVALSMGAPTTGEDSDDAKGGDGTETPTAGSSDAPADFLLCLRHPRNEVVHVRLHHDGRTVREVTLSLLGALDTIASCVVAIPRVNSVFVGSAVGQHVLLRLEQRRRRRDEVSTIKCRVALRLKQNGPIVSIDVARVPDGSNGPSVEHAGAPPRLLACAGEGSVGGSLLSFTRHALLDPLLERPVAATAIFSLTAPSADDAEVATRKRPRRERSSAADGRVALEADDGHQSPSSSEESSDSDDDDDEDGIDAREERAARRLRGGPTRLLLLSTGTATLVIASGRQLSQVPSSDAGFITNEPTLLAASLAMPQGSAAEARGGRRKSSLAGAACYVQVTTDAVYVLTASAAHFVHSVVVPERVAKLELPGPCVAAATASQGCDHGLAGDTTHASGVLIVCAGGRVIFVSRSSRDDESPVSMDDLAVPSWASQSGSITAVTADDRRALIFFSNGHALVYSTRSLTLLGLLASVGQTPGYTRSVFVQDHDSITNDVRRLWSEGGRKKKTAATGTELGVPHVVAASLAWLVHRGRGADDLATLALVTSVGDTVVYTVDYLTDATTMGLTKKQHLPGVAASTVSVPPSVTNGPPPTDDRSGTASSVAVSVVPKVSHVTVDRSGLTGFIVLRQVKSGCSSPQGVLVVSDRGLPRCHPLRWSRPLTTPGAAVAINGVSQGFGGVALAPLDSPEAGLTLGLVFCTPTCLAICSLQGSNRGVDLTHVSPVSRMQLGATPHFVVYHPPQDAALVVVSSPRPFRPTRAPFDLELDVSENVSSLAADGVTPVIARVKPRIDLPVISEAEGVPVPTTERYALQLVGTTGSASSAVLHCSVPCEENEIVLCAALLKAWQATPDAPIDYLFAVGSGFPLGEDVPCRGTLRVLRCTAKTSTAVVGNSAAAGKPPHTTGLTLAPFCIDHTKGPVTAITPLADGRTLAVAVGSTLRIMAYDKASSYERLTTVAFYHHMGSYIRSLSSFQGFIVVGDVSAGTHLLRYRAADKHIALLARDPLLNTDVTVTDVIYRTSGGGGGGGVASSVAKAGFLSFDSDQNVRILHYAPRLTHDGTRVLTGALFTGGKLASAMKITGVASCAVRMGGHRGGGPTASRGSHAVAKATLLYATHDGEVSLVSPMAELDFLTLKWLAGRASLEIPVAAGLNPAVFQAGTFSRQQLSTRLSELPGTGPDDTRITDAGFVKQQLTGSSPHAAKVGVAHRSGTNLNRIVTMLAALDAELPF